jgi:hypothetical protein
MLPPTTFRVTHARDLEPSRANAFPDGQAYTESEHRAWLAAAGFVDITRSPFPGMDHSLMTARKPG